MNLLTDPIPELLPIRQGDAVRFIFDAASAQVGSVALAGTFNSWVGDACMLEQVTPTRWQATLAIPPGRHLYKFVIDGTEWTPDPANPWISEDGQNNSCLTVDEHGEVLMRQRGLGPAAPGPLYQRHQALASPQWLHDAVIYQLSVRAFGGTFDGVRARLDYLQELGINVIWMMPVHAIGKRDRRGTLGDPYAVRDFEAIDPALGDSAGLRALVDAIHARGMRIVYDWTLNRSSADHPLTVSHPDWYTRRADGTVYYAVPERGYFAGFDFRNRALRSYLLGAMQRWIARYDIDGLRFDDSDITPTDYLAEIRAALATQRPGIALISQAYDEFHHLASCDLTYEGGTREVLRRIAQGQADAGAFAAYWNESTYSFPRGALRMRWLEDKEQPRANMVLGAGAHRAAAALLLTMDGVPHMLMGQEFAEPGWRDWTVLFNDYRLDWNSFDRALHDHYRTLIALRREHSALRSDITAFIEGLPHGVIGMRRGGGREAITVLANLSNQPVPLPAVDGKVLYTQGWDAAHRMLAAHGCVLQACA
jgi:glycosidase